MIAMMAAFTSGEIWESSDFRKAGWIIAAAGPRPLVPPPGAFADDGGTAVTPSNRPVCGTQSRSQAVLVTQPGELPTARTSIRKWPTMRTVLVGASSGSGRAIGSGLGQRGAQVALLARRKDRLVDAAKEAGEGSLAVACDVTDEESVKAAVEDAAAQLGGIDALVFVDVEDLTHVVHTVITNGAAIKPVVVDARRTVPLPLNIPAQTS